MISASDIGILRDITVAVCSIAGVRAAWIGLNVWKTQTKWNDDNNLARKLLFRLYKHRQAVTYASFAADFNISMLQAISDEKLDEMLDDKMIQSFGKTLPSNWEAVTQSNSQLEPLLVEGKVIWGIEFSDLVKPILAAEEYLQAFYFPFDRLKEVSTNEGDVDYVRHHLLRYRRDSHTMFTDNSMEDKSSLTDHYETQFRQIEEFLIEKMGRNS